MPGRKTAVRIERFPSPALLALLERLTEARLTVLVPGAGRHRDAVAWAAAGHEVTALDDAPDGLERCHRQGRDAGVRFRIVLADLLHLPRDLEAAFDCVWEQTCFCGLGPVERRAYVGAMARALKPGGRLYGLFRHHGSAGGPPYDVTEACVHAIFGRCFVVESFEGAPARGARRDTFLAVLRRRG